MLIGPFSCKPMSIATFRIAQEEREAEMAAKLAEEQQPEPACEMKAPEPVQKAPQSQAAPSATVKAKPQTAVKKTV
jgi:hypothetical protein